MGETFSKKEKEKKKAKEKQEKAERMKERKASSVKGKSLEDMMAYLDEDGNIVSEPPVPGKRKEINIEDIQLGAAVHEPESAEKEGVVAFFNEAKGYGFITELKTRENVFVHVSQLQGPLKEGERVTFEKEKTAKGISAVRVKKMK